jgi:hypothetical protein
MNSDRLFHVMRDHPSHSAWTMSSGMWCGVTGIIPDIVNLMLNERIGPGYIDDQSFLNKIIWPLVKKSVLQHDAFSCDQYGGIPFPLPRTQWEHVGSVFINGVMRQSDVDILVRTKLPCNCTNDLDKQALSYCSST